MRCILCGIRACVTQNAALIWCAADKSLFTRTMERPVKQGDERGVKQLQVRGCLLLVECLLACTACNASAGLAVCTTQRPQ